MGLTGNENQPIEQHHQPAVGGFDWTSVASRVSRAHEFF